MKPGEMSADQLIDALEIVSQEIERQSDLANEANGAYVEHAAIRAQLLARLNAGGSGPEQEPTCMNCGEDIVWVHDGNYERLCDGNRGFARPNVAESLQRHFPGSAGAAHRIPENKNQAEATCSFEFGARCAAKY